MSRKKEDEKQRNQGRTAIMWRKQEYPGDNGKTQRLR